MRKKISQLIQHDSVGRLAEMQRDGRLVDLFFGAGVTIFCVCGWAALCVFFVHMSHVAAIGVSHAGL